MSALSKIFLRIYSRVARSPGLFAVLQRLASLGTHLISPLSQWIRLPAFTGWGYSKDLPRFAAKPFRKRFNREEAKNAKIIQKEGKEASTVTEKETLRGVYPEQQLNLAQVQMSRRAQSDINRTDQFIDELTKVSGNIIHTNANDLTNKVIGFLQSREINHIHLEPNVLHESVLQKAGITISHAPDAARRVGVTPHVSLSRKETCGVTKAVCGLADTGSVLIADGEGNPLQASLLPEIHIAVLRTSNILPSLADAMTLPIVHESKAAVVITGPSRTGDIEMSHTIGVHGPGEVHVFLVHTIC